jgi:hypothetical protein
MTETNQQSDWDFQEQKQTKIKLARRKVYIFKFFGFLGLGLGALLLLCGIIFAASTSTINPDSHQADVPYMKDLGIAFIVIGAVISGVSVWLFLT